MFCCKCGKQINENVMFCNFCGAETNLQRMNDRKMEVIYNREDQYQTEEEKYLQAEEYMNHHSYKEAMALYRELGSYKDSPVKKEMCLTIGLEKYKRTIGDAEGYLYRCASKNISEWNEYLEIRKQEEEASKCSWKDFWLDLIALGGIIVFFICGCIMMKIATTYKENLVNSVLVLIITICILTYAGLFASIIVLPFRIAKRRHEKPIKFIMISIVSCIIYFIWLFWFYPKALKVLKPIRTFRLLKEYEYLREQREYYENVIIIPYEKQIRSVIEHQYEDWIGVENMFYLESAVLYIEQHRDV